MDEKKYKLICVRKGKTNYARTNNRKNVTLGSYIVHPRAKKLKIRISPTGKMNEKISALSKIVYWCQKS